MMKEKLDAMLASMTPDLYERLAAAVETGKWPDGNALTSPQREHCMQLVMLYQARHNANPQHMTIGQDGNIVTKSKQALKEEWGIGADVTRIDLH